MRRLMLILAVLAFAAVDAGPATAQEAAQELTFTGCLAEAPDDAEVEYVLQGITGAEMDAEKVHLVAGEGVDLAPHVGHTVEITGTVEHTDAEMEGEGEEKASGGTVVHVTGMSHVSASCSSGSDG